MMSKLKKWICIIMLLVFVISSVFAREETPNLTVLTEKLSQINITHANITINQTDFISKVVLAGNERTNGWLGITFFYMTGILIFLIFCQTSDIRQLKTAFNCVLTSLFVWIMIGMFFISFGVLENYSHFISILTAFFIFVFIGVIAKAEKSPIS